MELKKLKLLVLFAVLAGLCVMLFNPVGFINAGENTVVMVESDHTYVKPGDSQPVNLSFKVTNVSDVTSLALLLPFDPERVAPVDTDPGQDGVQPWSSAKFLGAGTNLIENLVTADNKASLSEYTLGAPAASDTPKKLADISFTIKPGAPDGTININPTYNNSPNDIVQLVDSQSHFISYTGQPARIIIDGTAPLINLAQTPDEVNEEQAGTNIITITGTVQEANLDTVKVNGQLATLNGNGFSCNVSLQDGVNVINVVATDKAGNSSNVERNITFIASKPAAPTANPEPGTYAGGVMVRLATTTPGAAIYYTTDGSEPTEGSTPYTDKITITSNTTIKAIAVKDGKKSDVATFEYAIGLPGPGDDALNQLANELVRVYSNMDDNDKRALETAKANINAPGLDWNQLLTTILNNLTDNAKNALGPDPCAQLRYFILEGLNIYYTPNTNVDQVAQQLKIFRSTYKPMITRVFDGGVTVEDIWNFILAVQNALPDQFTKQDLEDLLDKGFAIIEDRLQEWVNGAIDQTLNSPDYQIFKDKLADVGLTRDVLIQTKDNLFNAAEPDLLAVQAVVKGYVRSRVELGGKTTIEVNDTETYQLKAMGIDLAPLLNWYSSNNVVAKFTQGSTLKALAVGTTTITAYWEKGGMEKAWLARYVITSIAHQKATLSGKVVKEDKSPFGGVTVSLLGGEKEYQTTTDEKGNFFFHNLLRGTYRLTAFAPGHKKAEKEIVIVAEENILSDPIVLTATNKCDFDGSGTVDDEDLKLILQHYRLTASDPGWKSTFDVYLDNRIDILDMVIVGKNFGR